MNFWFYILIWVIAIVLLCFMLSKGNLFKPKEESHSELIEWLKEMFPPSVKKREIWCNHRFIKGMRKFMGDDRFYDYVTKNEFVTTDKGIKYLQRFLKKYEKKQTQTPEV